jgi:hypothetical protein
MAIKMASARLAPPSLEWMLLMCTLTVARS